MNIQSMSLDDWLHYFEQLHPKAIDLNLDRVEKVRDRLELSPKFPLITVAGTNGKGSVCAMLESILHCAAYRVGCYTSPHLLHYNERIKINQQTVADDVLCKAFIEIELARQSAQVTLTYFEFGTLAAMLIFMRAQVDVAILEVGLGGRLDAVNIFDTNCAVLTSIDLDHTDYLGNTREAIGFEKIGVFRANKPAICAERHLPINLLLKMEATNAQLFYIDQDFGYALDNLQWRYTGITGHRHNLSLPALRGNYQLKNASAALAALESLEEALPISMNAIRRGLTEATLPGRFQLIATRPTIVLDVAHNPAAAQELSTNLAAIPVKGCTYAVVGMLKDKDMVGTLRAVQDQVDYWLLAGLEVGRGATQNELLQALQVAGINELGRINTFQDIWNAYIYARKHANSSDRICVFGSFYTVSAILKHHGEMVFKDEQA